jgi:hypothetical protein
MTAILLLLISQALDETTAKRTTHHRPHATDFLFNGISSTNVRERKQRNEQQEQCENLHGRFCELRIFRKSGSSKG